jgi:hypothetical protein
MKSFELLVELDVKLLWQIQSVVLTIQIIFSSFYVNKFSFTNSRHVVMPMQLIMNFSEENYLLIFVYSILEIEKFRNFLSCIG